MLLMYFFVVSIVASAAAFLIKNTQINHIISICYTFVLIAFTVVEHSMIGHKQLVYFMPDALGFLLLSIMAIISFFTAIHYKVFADRRKEKSYVVGVHNSMFILFTASLTGVFTSNHFGLMWAFIEATTLTGAALIYHNRTKLVVEAVWKYLFVCSISIAIAFAGILFLSITTLETPNIDFSFKSIAQYTSIMNPIWMKACFLFILTGFSVKMGVVPLFNVDIDAKDVSPSPVGAIFSSALLNAGFIAIFRFYAAFAGTEIVAWMNHVLLISGVLTVLFAAVYLVRVKNYKRLFAYSSMEHAGLVLVALSLGKAGYYAAILHLVLHSFVKASLFFQIGQVHRVFNSKLDGEAGGYFYRNPTGGLALLAGLFSVLAIPPSGMFVSEFMIFKALFLSSWWLAVPIILLLTVIMFTMLRFILRLLFIEPVNLCMVREVKIPAWESISQFLLIGTAIYLGFAQPFFLQRAINTAIQVLP